MKQKVDFQGKSQRLSRISLEIAAPGPSDQAFAVDLIPDYEIVEKIGTGAVTTVYKVRRVGIDEVFAAKVLRFPFSENPRTIKRFVEEGQKAAKLDHVHLLSVFDTGKTVKGEPFIICEYVDGGSLAGRLDEFHFLSQVAVLDLFLPLCEALGTAHRSGVLHRGISPGNIVFKKNGAVELAKICDFGVSKVLPGRGRETKFMTPEGDTAGNATYMSPEQVRGARLDERSDIYALGCVIYQALCGQPPFVGKNNVLVALQQVEGIPQPLLERNPHIQVSPVLEQVVMRMLEKDPADRYQNMDKVYSDLQTIRRGGTPDLPVPKALVASNIIAAPCAEADKPQRYPHRVKLKVLEKDDGDSYKSTNLLSNAALSMTSSAPAIISEPKRTAPQSWGPAAHLEKLAKSNKSAFSFCSNLSIRQVVIVCSLTGFCLGVVACTLMQYSLSQSAPMQWLNQSDQSLYQKDAGEYYIMASSIEASREGVFFLKHFYKRNGELLFSCDKNRLDMALSEMVSRGISLADVNLDSCDLRGAKLADADLTGASLRNCQLQNIDFRGANLQGADLSLSNLFGADLRHANCRGAKFSNSKLNGAILDGKALDGADLTGSDYSLLKSYDNAQRDQVENTGGVEIFFKILTGR